MSTYRRGTILGLTVAETFLLLTFLLLIALLGLVQRNEPRPESNPESTPTPRVWVHPDRIETLVNAAEDARKAQQEAEQARRAAERERDQAQRNLTLLRREYENLSAQVHPDRIETLVNAAEDARKAQQEAEQARRAAERERDQAQRNLTLLRREYENLSAQVHPDRIETLVNAAEDARKAQQEAEQARRAAERERDQAQRNLTLLRRKGKNPPCWYQILSAGHGKTREKPYYVFNVAIYEDSIELAPRTAPSGGAFDDGGGPYTDEWERLLVDDLPYGRKLSDNEFTEAVRHLVAQGRNRQVRTYECVFSVMVWDKTPGHAKKRWKTAHDRIIEGLFNAYTVQDLEWKSASRPPR